MGLFSRFKKNDAPPAAPAADAARLAAEQEAERLRLQARQREIARATALKIDAIESAMSFDIFNEPELPWGSPQARPAAAIGVHTLPGHAGTELLDENALPQAAVAAESAPVVEEAAILYANGQSAAAQQILQANLAAGGPQDRTVWSMLFDLFQLTGQQDAFDDLSIDYASTFETSPPAWHALAAPPAGVEARAGIIPTELLAGALDAGCAPQLDRLRQLAATSPALRLGFGPLRGATPDGCALLLAALRQWRAEGRELILDGAAGLAALLRAGIAVGRRDDTEAPWLLLLELLQLLNREKDFEETAMDYCVTFEVSPPSFAAPRQAVAAVAAAPSPAAARDRFLLPPLIDHPTTALLAAIADYAGQGDRLVFDCSRLVRVDFNAAQQLHSCALALASQGKQIEFRDVNHLVSALMRLLGYADLARIHPHKY